MKKPHDVDIYVGKKIRYRRWNLQMSQKELGELVGIQFQQIQKYETGANRVSASRLWEIANALSVPITYFFDEDALKEQNNSFLSKELEEKSRLLSVPEVSQFLSLYLSLSDESRESILTFGKFVSNEGK